MKYIAVLDSLDRLSEEAIEDIKHTVFCGDEQARYCFDIDSIEEVTDQTRKKGHWIGSCKIGFGEFAEYEVELIDGFVTDNCHCSECGEELEKGERGIYCPNCGRSMIKE